MVYHRSLFFPFSTLICCAYQSTKAMSRHPLAMHVIAAGIALLSTFDLIIAQTTPGCYFPDGSSSLDAAVGATIWQPCNREVGGHGGSCCMSNYTEANAPEFGQDSCHPNGLCKNRHRWANGTYTDQWWAPICTDREWNSPNCIKLPSENLCNVSLTLVCPKCNLKCELTFSFFFFSSHSSSQEIDRLWPTVPTTCGAAWARNRNRPRTAAMTR